MEQKQMKDDDENVGLPIFERRINFDKKFEKTGKVYTCKRC